VFSDDLLGFFIKLLRKLVDQVLVVFTTLGIWLHPQAFFNCFHFFELPIPRVELLTVA